MSFHSWLQKLRFALDSNRHAPCDEPGTHHAGRNGYVHRRRGSLRARSRRPNLEVLDDRSLPSFSPAASFPVGSGPQAVATADFNNDGHLDLVTANRGDNTVSVLLGDGQGGFGAASHFAATSYAFAVGDFNNDGNLDLATARSAGVSVRLGNGDGTFQPPVHTGLPNLWRLSMAAADFNADGKMDLVVSSGDPIGSGEGRVELLLGDGAGGFAASDVYVEVGHPVLAVADLNADGIPDVAMADEWGTSVLLGNGDGTLVWCSVSYGSPRAVAVGDFTGDGIPDLVTGGQTVDVLPGIGDGTFATAIRNDANGVVETPAAVADFNGDGKLDVITTGAGSASVLLGRGDGTLTPPLDLAAGSSPAAVAVGDFNADARPDVAAANPGSNTVSVLLNDGAWPDLNTPWLQIRDVTVPEGNTGAVAAVFTVTLSAASDRPVTVGYATGNGTATAGSDYQPAAGTLIIPAGQTTGTITVLVNGDRLGEPNEAFFVHLVSPTNAFIVDGPGVGTVLDDEPRISITDVSKLEGKNGKTSFVFTVRLSAAPDQAVTMSYRTADGTATAGSGDYVARTGTLTFAPGETTRTITIEVKGDNRREANEAFTVELFGAGSNAVLLDAVGLGTIVNDD